MNAHDFARFFQTDATKGERNSLRHLHLSNSMGQSQCSIRQVTALWSILLMNSNGVYLDSERPKELVAA